MFWLDVGIGMGMLAAKVVKPAPALGLLQVLDENWVASLLWHLAGGEEAAPSEPNTQLMFEALASDRMMTPPFARGYIQRSWDVDEDCQAVNVQETGKSVPALPDFLDALVGLGMSPDDVTAATQPKEEYPYDANKPLCQVGGVGSGDDGAGGEMQAPESPLRLAMRAEEGVAGSGTLRLTASVWSSIDGDVPVKLTARLPDGVDLVDGSQEQVLPLRRGTQTAVPLLVRHDSVPMQDIEVEMDVQTAGWGVRGVARHTFGREPARTVRPERAGPERTVKGRHLGHFVPLLP